jgi:type I restriction enzyme R subunit
VFGDYVDVYDIEQAQKDEATKPLFYESRMIPFSEDANVDKESLNAEAEEIIAGYEDNQKEKIKAHHAALEALIT